MNVAIWGFDVSLDESWIAVSNGEIREQLREYEQGDRREFDLAIRVPESFTGAVMEAIETIPYGETRTYGELAATLDTSPVAVGGGCGHNPIPLVIPCHRVVGQDSLGGFSAGGDRAIELKEALLAHERQSAQTRLDTYS